VNYERKKRVFYETPCIKVPVWLDGTASLVASAK